MSKIYIIGYTQGEYSSTYNEILKATANKELADLYYEKLNEHQIMLLTICDFLNKEYTTWFSKNKKTCFDVWVELAQCKVKEQFGVNLLDLDFTDSNYMGYCDSMNYYLEEIDELTEEDL